MVGMNSGVVCTDLSVAKVAGLRVNLGLVVLDPSRHRHKIGDKTRYVALQNAGIAAQDVLVHYVNGIALRYHWNE